MDTLAKILGGAAAVTFAFGIFCILCVVAIASLVLCYLLGVAFWKVFVIVLGTVIVTKLFD